MVKPSLGPTHMLWSGRTACPLPSSPTHTLGLSVQQRRAVAGPPCRPQQRAGSTRPRGRPFPGPLEGPGFWRGFAASAGLLRGPPRPPNLPRGLRFGHGWPRWEKGPGTDPVGKRVLWALPPGPGDPVPSLVGGLSSVQRPGAQQLACGSTGSPRVQKFPRRKRRVTQRSLTESQQRRALSACTP